MFADYHIPIDNSDLPSAERAIANVIGRSAAIRLSWRMLHMRCQRVLLSDGSVDKRFGDFYVPKTYSAEFAERVGDESAARDLIARFGGEQFQLTGCRQAIKRLQTYMIRKLHECGAKRADIVWASMLTDRTVRRLCVGEKRGIAKHPEVIRTHLNELRALSFMIAADPL